METVILKKCHAKKQNNIRDYEIQKNLKNLILRCKWIKFCYKTTQDLSAIKPLSTFVFLFFWVFFGEDQSCSITILSVCDSPFAWRRHFTTTTWILRVYAFLRKLAPLLFKPCWGYQISRMTLSCKWPIQSSGHAILILYVVIDIS